MAIGDKRINLDVLKAIHDADAADVADLKSAINGGQVTESVTASVPTSFNTSSNRCTLNLTDYTGKKAFISNKNLFPLYPSLVNNGVTLTPNADGSITLSGTATAAATFQISGNVMPTVGNGTFTLSANNTVAIGDNLTYINPSINGSYGTVGCRLNSVNATETFTLGLTDRITAIRIRISSGVTFPENYKLFIQLEEGTEKTAFVPHEGSIIDITKAETQATCFEGYNYVAVQRDVSGTVTYVTTKSTGGVINSVNDLKDDVESLDTRVTALEQAEPTATKKFTGKKIVCFGDSITGNFPAPTDYPSMIAEITGATVYNVGFGGCCMCDNGQTRRLFTMCRLADSIVAGDFSAQANSGVSITYAGTSINYVPERIATLESIDWSTIDYITIAYGTNDWNANYGLDNENNPLDTTTYIGAFRYSIEKLLAAYPNIKAFVLTPLWRFWDTNTGLPSEITSDYIDSNDYHKGTGYYLWNYGNALMEAAEKYQIPVFDLYHNCMMNRYNRLQYFNATDGTHPKLEGRELMAAMISARMEAAY